MGTSHSQGVTSAIGAKVRYMIDRYRDPSAKTVSHEGLTVTSHQSNYKVCDSSKNCKTYPKSEDKKPQSHYVEINRKDELRADYTYHARSMRVAANHFFKGLGSGSFESIITKNTKGNADILFCKKSEGQITSCYYYVTTEPYMNVASPRNTFITMASDYVIPNTPALPVDDNPTVVAADIAE